MPKKKKKKEKKYGWVKSICFPSKFAHNNGDNRQKSREISCDADDLIY